MAQQEDRPDRQQDTRQELVQLLLDKVRDDPYPSVTMLDLLEEVITPEDRPAYASVLMEKVRRDNFPSLDMMARLRDLS